MTAQLTNNELDAIENAVSFKKSIKLPSNKICVLQGIDKINKNITCSVNGDNAPMIISFSDIVNNQYELSTGGSNQESVLVGKEKAKSRIERRNIVKQRRVEDLGEALEVEDR